jgi:aminopeptidase N
MHNAIANEPDREQKRDQHKNSPNDDAAGYHWRRLSRRSYLFLGLAAGLLAVAWMVREGRRTSLTDEAPTDGISLALAQARARSISALRYDLTFNIPERRQDAVTGHESLTFRLTDSSQPLQIDFTPPTDRLSSLAANGKPLPVHSSHGHVVIPTSALRDGDNRVDIAFLAGEVPLNRNDDFLYSLFVPARASQAFPCFDQPDLKAALTLTLEIPASWEAVSNGFERARETAAGRTTVHFAPTQLLPTYLFGFAAGKFSIERGERKGRPFKIYHRETDPVRLARNRDAIFDLHEQAIEWLENYTGRRYPFEKMDFVLIPAFQFTGMEHAGALFYNASSLLLEESATQEQELARASVIAHETAHMWFGDLVTMKWFDDVWMKEVFANFMAAKIVAPSFPDVDQDLRFLLQHYESAYEIDRTSGANSIRQRLDNLNETGSLYGNIIYDKAPIVMRQLEDMLGPDNLRDGLREYLTRFAFGNATWTDLIQILDARTDENLAAWSHAWIDEPGRPTVSVDVQIDGGHLVNLVFSQSDPRGRPLIWNQRLRVAMGFPTGMRITPLHLTAARVVVPIAQPLPQPLYILPNGEGVGYGLFRLDDASKAYLLEHLPEVGHAVTRATVWLTLWDDMLDGGTPPQRLIELALRSLPVEREEQNVQRILGYLSDAYWIFIPEADRAALAPRVETALRAGIDESQQRSLKAAYFAAFRRMVTTRDGVAYLERVWRRQVTIPGLPFAEPDEIAMAQELAVRDVASTEAILKDELARIENPDRRARFAFISPALSSDAATRDRFFESLATLDNRRHEPWVIDALSYLNHPLRAQQAERYIRPSLSLLAEVQRTGDIFFPSRWTAAALSGHSSPAAARTVVDFLSQQQAYPPRLRQIVEQSADTLVRASRIVSGAPLQH